MDTGSVSKKIMGIKTRYIWSHRCADSIKRTAGSWLTEEEAQKELDRHKERCG